MIVDDGVVYRKFERPTGGVLFYQLLVPKSMRAELLELIHAGAACHLGVRKTIDPVQRRDALPDDLSHDERTAALGFNDDWAHVFSKGEFDMGRTTRRTSYFTA